MADSKKLPRNMPVNILVAQILLTSLCGEAMRAPPGEQDELTRIWPKFTATVQVNLLQMELCPCGACKEAIRMN